MTDLPVRKCSQGSNAWGISSPLVLYVNLSQLEEQEHLQKTKTKPKPNSKKVKVRAGTDPLSLHYILLLAQ